MTILVFGKTGQVATELAALPAVLCLGREQADLSDPARCKVSCRRVSIWMSVELRQHLLWKAKWGKQPSAHLHR